MIQYHRLNSQKDIYEKLIDFFDVFSDLKERVVSISEYSRKLNDNAVCYIMIENNNNIGFVSFYGNDIKNGVGYISLIGIKEIYRHKGYGYQLLNFCCVYLKKNNIKKVQLEVNNSNFTAIEFYQRNGFKKINRVSQSNSFYMEKAL